MTDVINMADFKKKQEESVPDVEFGERLQRIRASLEKINHLMASLREMNRGDV